MNQQPLKSVENFDDFLNMKYNNFGSDIKQDGKEDKFDRNKDETLDITIFRDMLGGNRKNENNINKAELNAPAVTSDPKINKLLSEVDDIVQRALGNAPKNDNSSNKDKWGINKYTINGVKNVELENQEIRAYLKNLDCKLNILAPTTIQPPTPNKKKCAKKITEESEENSENENESSSEKKSIKNRDKYDFDDSSKKKKGSKNMNEGSYEIHEKSFSKIKANKRKDNPDFDGSFKIMNNNKKIRNNKKSSSPTQSQISRTSTRSRSIFLKEDENKKMKANEMRKYTKEYEKICDNSRLKELEANEISFCVNCEEFLNLKEINSHSLYCLLSSRIMEKENLENKNSEIKRINEKLSKLMKFLFSKLNVLEKNTPKNGLILLSRLLELLSHLIHSKDFQLSLNLNEQINYIYENLLQIYDETIMKIFLPLSEKINLFSQQKIDCLNTYSSVARTKYNKNFDNESLFSQNNRNNCNDMVNSRTLNNKRGSFFDFSPSKYSNLGSSTYGGQEINFSDKIKKRKFFEVGILIKLGLNKSHPAQKMNFSDLFLKSCRLGVEEREWEGFILESVKEMEEEMVYQDY